MCGNCTLFLETMVYITCDDQICKTSKERNIIRHPACLIGTHDNFLQISGGKTASRLTHRREMGMCISILQCHIKNAVGNYKQASKLLQLGIVPLCVGSNSPILNLT